MRTRRGIVLATVSVIGVASLWMATAMVQVAAVTVSASDLDARRTNQLLRLESALTVLLSRLSDQRLDCATGLPLQLPQQVILWEEGRWVVVARLVPDPETDEVLVPEASRLDVNTADEASLARLEGIDDQTAAAIIQARTAAASGQLIDHRAVLDAAGLGLDAPSADMLTVLAHEPVLRPDDLVVEPWSDELAAEVRRAFGEEAVGVLSGLPEGTPQDFALRVAAASASAQQWGSMLAGVAPAETGYIKGRIDLAQAPASVLATLPGIDDATAAQLVKVRAGLSDDERSLLSWPWTEGVLDRAAEPELLGRLTVGSWTWRCTLACGVVLDEDLDGAMQDVLRYEVVFDVSDETPRIASLRSVLLVPEHIGKVPLPETDDEEDASLDEEVDAPVIDAGIEQPLPTAPFDDEPEAAELSDTEPAAMVDDPRLGRWR